MEDTITVNYSANVEGFSKQVDEIIELAEKLRDRLDKLGIKVTIGEDPSSTIKE